MQRVKKNDDRHGLGFASSQWLVLMTLWWLNGIGLRMEYNDTLYSRYEKKNLDLLNFYTELHYSNPSKDEDRKHTVVLTEFRARRFDWFVVEGTWQPGILT